MKIRIGGTTEIKVMAAQYEPISASATVELEVEKGEYSQEEMDILEKKVQSYLEGTLKQRIKIAQKVWSEFNQERS